MSPTRCPSCRRALALRDHLRGELVRCPMCGTSCNAPEEPGPARTTPPGSAVTQAPAPPPRPMPAADCDPDALHRDPGLTPDDRASLRSAATWLKAAVVFNAVGTMFRSCPAHLFYLPWKSLRGEWADSATSPLSLFINRNFYLLWESLRGGVLLAGQGVMVLWLIVLVVMGDGPRHLRERRDYPRAKESGILTFHVGLASLAQSAYLAWEARDIPYPPVLALVALFVVALGLTCTLTALVAGLKTLDALSRPGVKESFR
jgi:hypothetical protein